MDCQQGSRCGLVRCSRGSSGLCVGYMPS